MRPWMERFEDQLWVSYDRGNQIELVSNTLNLDVLEPDEEEPAEEPSTEPTEPRRDDPLVSISKEGGCAGVLGFPFSSDAANAKSSIVVVASMRWFQSPTL